MPNSFGIVFGLGNNNSRFIETPAKNMTNPKTAILPIIRPTEAGDLPEVQEIYAHYVLHGLASFEIEPPDLAEMQSRWERVVSTGFPHFVAEIDGIVGGYAYANTFRSRPAYNNTVENSVYVSPNFLGRGLGGTLLRNLIDQCADQGFRQMIAVIGDSQNAPSINLHLRHGFERAGLLPSTGYKHNRWVDTVIMQRPLGSGDQKPPERK